MMALTIVVFPVPGPPVITRTFFSIAFFMASLCFSASCIWLSFSTHWMAFSVSILARFCEGVSRRVLKRLAAFDSAI